MKLLLLIAAVGVGSSLSTPAFAAWTPSAERYVSCVAQQRPEAMHALLQATDTRSAKRPYRTLRNDEHCFSAVFNEQRYNPQDVDFPMSMLRGKLAEQALLSKVGQAKALAALPFEQKRYTRPWFGATGRDPSIDEMSACIADTDPAHVLFLVTAVPGSYDENDAIAGIQPSLGKCLSSNVRLQTDRPSLRAALADALYQRMINPALSAPAQETPK